MALKTISPSTPPRSAAINNAIGSDEVFSLVYEAVLDHRLPPGTKLREVPLAELFGVTRGTIRKAFTQLANRKIIDLTPNRGASVAFPSVEESRDLFAARRTIESAIVELLALRISKAQLRELNLLVKRENMAYQRGDTRTALKLSVDFHRVLASMAGNTVFAELLDQLLTRTPLVVLAYCDPAQSTACANRDHLDLVEAIAAHDVSRAINTMRCHLCNLEGQLNLAGNPPVSELAAIFGIDSAKSSKPNSAGK
jgi:DNA-binding GntR family transcriptional regulator